MLRQRTATNQLEHFHFCLLHNDAAHSVRSLAPRSEAERGEGWGEGHFFGAPPSPDPSCGDHRGALSPQAGRGRNNDDRTRGHISPFFHTAVFVPAARFLRPGFATLASLPRSKGGGAPRVVGCLRGTRWACT